jgi:hypothetical protein
VLLSSLLLWQQQKWFSDANNEDDCVALDLEQLEHSDVREFK